MVAGYKKLLVLSWFLLLLVGCRGADGELSADPGDSPQNHGTVPYAPATTEPAALPDEPVFEEGLIRDAAEFLAGSYPELFTRHYVWQDFG